MTNKQVSLLAHQLAFLWSLICDEERKYQFLDAFLDRFITDDALARRVVDASLSLCTDPDDIWDAGEVVALRLITNRGLMLASSGVRS